MRVNYPVQASTHFSVLGDSQCEEIFLASLEVLEKTGVRIHHPEAVALLASAGAFVRDDNLVKFPTWLVEESIASAPRKIALCTRDGRRRLVLAPNHVYFGAGSDTPFIIDPYTGERRLCTYADVAGFSRVADALPHLDFHMSLGLVSDCPQRATYDRHQYMAMATNTTKPILATAVDERGLADIYEMACLVAGGTDSFQEAPILAVYLEATSPLQHSQTCVAKALFAADKGIPMVYTPGLLVGATTPATLAGALVIALAECLAGVVVTQVRRRGAKVIMGGVPCIMDMRDTTPSYDTADFYLLSAALADLAKWLELPSFSSAGTTDAKLLDEQAGIGAALSILTATLSGANLIHDVGFLEAAMVGSAGMMVMSNEIIGLCKHFARGVVVDEDHLAVDVIDAVGPGGHFLAEPHTVSHFRKELWFPQLLDRRKHERWADDGSKRLSQRVEERVREILETHQPVPLPEGIASQLADICALADRQAQ